MVSFALPYRSPSEVFEITPPSLDGKPPPSEPQTSFVAMSVFTGTRMGQAVLLNMETEQNIA